MSVTTIHEWRRPDCGSRCSPRSCDAQAHYAAGYAAGYAQAEADAAPALVRTGRLVVDLAREVVTVDGVELAPTGREWGVLAYLAGHAGAWCERDDIVRAVWGEAWLPSASPILTVALDRLRRRLGPAGGLIETQRSRLRCRRLRMEEATP